MDDPLNAATAVNHSPERHSVLKWRSRHTNKKKVAEQRRNQSSIEGDQALWSYEDSEENDSKASRTHGKKTMPYQRILKTSQHLRAVLWIGACLVGVLLPFRLPLFQTTRQRHVNVVVWNDHPLSEPELSYRWPITSFSRPLSCTRPALSRGDPDFGELVLLEHRNGKEIPINPMDYDRAEEQRDSYLGSIDGDVEDKYLPESSKVDWDEKCRLPSYAAYSFPTCNSLHELRLENERDEGLEVTYLNSGYFRDAFRYQRQTPSNSDDFVMKRMKFRRTLGYKALVKVRKEALILERLTPSPRVLDIYSHCGYSVLVEAMASDINEQIVPYKGYMRQSKLDEMQEFDVHPRNNFTVSEKLQIALDMAESLADIHGFQGGLIVHADVHLDQWLVAPDRSVKLNDFGDSYQAPWDRKRKEYCFRNDVSHSGTWRAPEEYVGDLQDEAIDVYVFGNNIYTLLTGLWPFYHEEYTDVDYAIIRWDMNLQDKRPFVDPRYRSRSFIESKLVVIMEQCWAHKDQRVSIFEVVRSLRNLKRAASNMGILKSSSVIKIPMPRRR